VGVISASDFIHMLRRLKHAVSSGNNPLSEAEMDAHTVRGGVGGGGGGAGSCLITFYSAGQSPSYFNCTPALRHLCWNSQRIMGGVTGDHKPIRQASSCSVVGDTQQQWLHLMRHITHVTSQPDPLCLTLPVLALPSPPPLFVPRSVPCVTSAPWRVGPPNPSCTSAQQTNLPPWCAPSLNTNAAWHPSSQQTQETAQAHPYPASYTLPLFRESSTA
jgi:hypothetical protein